MRRRRHFMDHQDRLPRPDSLLGKTIGNYLVIQKLGEGGMGSVYLAEHPSIGKQVALKVLHPELSTNQEKAARLLQEAKAVNAIGHPNIIDIIDFGILYPRGGRAQLVYFIMEHLAGVTLSQLIHSEAPLPPERALGIAMQVADALSASHRCGIIHRDLKPDNIILLERGRERDFVKLLDFGIAKLTGGPAAGSPRTESGIVMGTPADMSPEQCEGRGTVDQRIDVYALGVVLYEMLTRRVPFDGDGYGEILVQHLTQRPTPPSQLRMMPAHIEVVVMRALEKRADRRFPTMDHFMRAMADPVGYVEAHGGVSRSQQGPLAPSSAPLPTVRLKPTPRTRGLGTLRAAGLSKPTRLHVAIGQVAARPFSAIRRVIGHVADHPIEALVIVIAAVIVAAIIGMSGNQLADDTVVGQDRAAGRRVESMIPMPWTPGGETKLIGRMIGLTQPRLPVRLASVVASNTWHHGSTC